MNDQKVGTNYIDELPDEVTEHFCGKGSQLRCDVEGYTHGGARRGLGGAPGFFTV